MPLDHEAGDRESISSLSEQYGFFADTLWALPANAHLRALKRDPTALLAGDRVHIPDLRHKKVICATGKRHPFVRKGVPGVFQLRLQRRDSDLAKEPYVLTVDGAAARAGWTDQQGWLREYLPLGAQSGKLELPRQNMAFTLDFGLLEPVETVQGKVQRLSNLGYACDASNWEAALAAYEAASGGALDAAHAAGLAR